MQVMIDLSLCTLHKTINPRDIPEHIQIACENAMQFLKDARDGVLVVDLDPAPETAPGQPYQRTFMESQVKFVSKPFQDLQLLPEFRLAIMRQDKESFERILLENGLDVGKGYNVEHCLHRSRITNKVNDCFRVVASERTDVDWLQNGCASLDAHIYSAKDKSLQMDLS